MSDMERDDRISAVTGAIVRSGLSQIDNDSFEMLCIQNGLNMSDFTQNDIYEIQRRLDRF